MLKAVSYLKIASKEDFFMRIALSFCKTSFGYNSCPALSRFALGVTDTTLDPVSFFYMIIVYGFTIKSS